jgi:hypothetical protein
LTEISAIEIAKRQRHLLLLSRVRQNQTLSKAELEELRRYERTMPAKKTVKIAHSGQRTADRKLNAKRSTLSAKKKAATKTVKRAKVRKVAGRVRSNRKSKIANRKSPKRSKAKRRRKRLPISAVRLKSLAFEYGSLTVADAHSGLDVPLAPLLEKHGRLAAAWERGQFLRSLAEWAAGILTVTQAAKKLGFETGQELRDLLDTDLEAGDLWQQTRDHVIAESKKALVERAKEGDVRAIKAVELLLRDEGGADRAALDYERLNLNQLAELFGVTRVTAGDWYKKQGLMRNGDGTFDLKTAIRWYEEFTLKKAARNKGPVGASPLHQVKASIQQLEYEKLKGELVGRGEVLGFQLAQLTSIVTAFGDLPGLANTMYQQPREQIVKKLEDFRDKVMAALQHVPDELKLSPPAMAKLKELHGELRS